MTKTKGTFAAFDVATDVLTGLISTWRETRVQPELQSRGVAGTFARCADATGLASASQWRHGPALAASLVSVCAHGSRAQVNGCASAALYATLDAATYAEISGAVVHLLACESLVELGPALVGDGHAAAVVGYGDVFVAKVPPGQEIRASTSVLPESLQLAIELDNQVLIGLADGLTVAQSVASAQEWAAGVIARLDQDAAAEPDPDRREQMTTARANLSANRDALGSHGATDAKIV